ncbi:SCO family protein [Sutcliffiella rhizosphaerae]|uniref:SCO1 protein n=1 Tax=Sutcliffiella rhizosphaerae TaxID=2880967 RepID=A0ABM8YKN2_9BACI|nr:SCO family protein [Sutcliffiella rhizosphaerae]CAG9620483.1 SCO1 protein [Sutcliffiella rhizosphaerae]
MNKYLILIFTIIAVLILSGCADKEVNLDNEFSMKLEVGELEAVNQDEQPFSTSDQNGEYWLANFIFTNCNTVCPPMTANMAKMQREMKEAGVEIPIVSFSIDPTNDTPAVMKEYAELYQPDYSTWTFVTGYAPETIERFANVSFMVPAAEEEGTDQFMHSTKFFLIDKEGYVREGYSGLDVPYADVIKDIKKVVD